MEITVHALRVNPAQMRTRVRVADLAQLAVQVKGGLDHNLAVILGPEDRVISGHRRWLALMIAYLAQADLDQPVPQTGEEELELMRATIERFCPVENGFIPLSEGLYADLVSRVPRGLCIPYRAWEGLPHEEVLLLIKANTGAEEPDLLGQARAYKAAQEAGVTWEKLAQVTGQPVGRLQAMVDLLALPQIFQDLVNDDLLDLSIVLDLQSLKSKAIKALGQALAVKYKADRKRASEEGFDLHDYKDYTSRVRLVALQLGMEPVMPDRKEVEPAVYNLYRAIGTLWAQAAESAASQLYRIIAAHSLEGERISGTDDYLAVLAEVPNLQDHVVIAEGAWDKKSYSLSKDTITELLPELDCATCAFIDLPPERIKHELPFACRENPSGVAAGPCLYWTPKGERFFLRTPWYWTRGGVQVTSFKELQARWQFQWEQEQIKPTDGLISGTADDMQEQRENIRFYMERHTQPPFLVDHPWATSCSRCAHHLDKSPVKSDPDAPHCTWAKGKRRLQFRAYVPKDGTIVAALGKVIPEGQGLVPFYKWEDWEPVPFIIPSCLQFEPKDEWAFIVPEADGQPPYTREVMIMLIKAMADSVNRNIYSTDMRGALQFLTGRPLSASASHRKTFPERFKKEEPMLSELQLWTLLQWLLLEWLRVHHHTTGQNVPMGAGQVLHANLTYFSIALEMSADTKKTEEK